MLGWVLLLYSLHRVCVTVLQTMLASVDCVLQCCKLYWLHGLYPVNVLNCYSVAYFSGCIGSVCFESV